MLERAVGRIRARAATPSDVVRVRDVAAFIPMLERIEREACDDADLRVRLAQIRLETPELRSLSQLDPFTREYRNEVLALYERLFGHFHDLQREGMTFDVESELCHPFPFSPGSAYVTGSYTVAYGYLIQVLGLQAGARILEVGSGSGALTWFLARAGYAVTAIEVNPSGAELTRRYCAGLSPEPRVVCGDLNTFEPDDEKFDAIVFFESFHHLLEHEAILARCGHWLLPDGVVALAAEPIVPAGSPIVPYPWGLRTDGESLRAMAKFGWIELGFQEPYLRDLLARGHWRVSSFGIAHNPWAQIKLLRR